MAFLAKGDQCSFIFDGKNKELVLSPDLLVLHELSGKYEPLGIRTCDFFIASKKLVLGPVSKSNEFIRKEASDYYGDLKDLQEIVVELGRSGWNLVRYVEMIRYHREGFLKDDYEHPYVEPQPLYECKAIGAYKIVAPDGCIAGAQGFEYP